MSSTPRLAAQGPRFERGCRCIVAALLAGLLAACGSSDDEDATTPTAEDVASARESGLVASFDSISREVVVTWTDEFDGERGYRVETRTGSGAWIVAETLPAAEGAGTSYRWRSVLDATTTVRVIAVRDSHTVPLEHTSGSSELTVDLQAASALSIELDQLEPVTGTVQLSVAGAAGAVAVRYLAGSSNIGLSATGPRFATEWNTAALQPGSHLLAARVEQPSGVVIERRRVVMVAAATAALSLRWQQSSPGVYRLIATASAASGIRRVEFFANDQSLGVVTSPVPNNEWVLEPFDATTLPPGAVVIKAIATGNSGERAEIAKRFTVDRLPQVTLEQPIDGAIVRIGDMLEIAGTVVDDLAGATVQVFIGDTLVREIPGDRFEIEQRTVGLNAGRRVVSVRVRDSAGQESTDSRTINVTASPLTFELVASLPKDTALLDTEGGSLLYELPDGAIHRWDAPGSEVELQGAADIFDLETPYPLEPWRMAGRYVTTVGSVDGTPTIYLFDPAGARREIPYVPGSFFNISLRSLIEGPWLASGTDLIRIQNLVTNTTHDVPGNLYNGSAFSAVPGSERLFFTRNNGLIESRTVVDLYAYRLANQAVTLLTGGGAVNWKPKTDGERVAWEQVPLPSDPNTEIPALLTAPTSNPTSSTVQAAAVRAWDLDDGWLAWLEPASGALVLKADDGSSTQTISSSSATGLLSTSAGHVIFSESGRLYTWSSTHGRRMLLETLPQQAVQDDGIAFIVTGDSTAVVYRVVQ